MRWPVALVCCVFLAAGCLESGRPDPTSDAVTPPEVFLDPHYASILIEVYHVAGVEPARQSLGLIQDRVVEATGKQDVRLDAVNVLDPKYEVDKAWTAHDLRDLAANNAPPGLSPGSYAIGGTAYLVIYYLNGTYDSPDAHSAVGVAIDGRAFVFRNESLTNPFLVAMREQLEEHVAIHEIGHVFGLVNCGIPMTVPHEAANSRCHSGNDQSVMSPSAINVSAETLPQGAKISTDFDQNDLNDLAAYRASLAEKSRGNTSAFSGT